MNQIIIFRQVAGGAGLALLAAATFVSTLAGVPARIRRSRILSGSRSTRPRFTPLSAPPLVTPTLKATT